MTHCTVGAERSLLAPLPCAQDVWSSNPHAPTTYIFVFNSLSPSRTELLTRGKSIDCSRTERLSRLQFRGWKIRMVRRVRIVLRFETKRGAPRVNHAALAVRGAVQRISGIQLETRFRRLDRQHSAARRLVRFGGQLQNLRLTFLVQHPVEVVAPADL